MFFDPKPNVFKEYYRSGGHFNTTALGLFGMGVQPMKQWWKKGDSGLFDTTPTPWTSQ